MTEKVHGIVLSGGGAYGAYEVGVLKALCGGNSPATGYTPLPLNVFTGTSVGSFNAAVMAMQGGVDAASSARYLENVWLELVAEGPASCGNGVFRIRGNPSNYFSPGCFTDPISPFATLASDTAVLSGRFFKRGFEFMAAQGSVAARALETVEISALISVEPFRRLLLKSLDFGAIRRSSRVLRVVATSMRTGDPQEFGNDQFSDEHGADIIMASAAIPGIFPPVKVDGELYVDGGVVMNTPLEYAIHGGANVLHVVYLDRDLEKIPLDHMRSTLSTLDRIYAISMAVRVNQDVASIQRINQGLDVYEAALRGDAIDDEQAVQFIRVVAQIGERVTSRVPYQRISLHRYHPHDDLGGALGVLNFSVSAIQGLIARGYDDTVHHDCDTSGCILI